ncbi:hypothetical protein ABL78_5654 [Leptomonas seymouri]|uniref:BTB domain-containing protein n=1 Tax=Leptomonas seymouri TaxID=5684 RepID=A0A0N0P4W2_LEPSE|nr:hypothetical protein ABL78_5654 [Leptomonas seymouri]|eukprot:KPI85287.1 hypothetical protein ABL78_5654 [Leptomonas seymouri]
MPGSVSGSDVSHSASTRYAQDRQAEVHSTESERRQPAISRQRTIEAAATMASDRALPSSSIATAAYGDISRQLARVGQCDMGLHDYAQEDDHAFTESASIISGLPEVIVCASHRMTARLDTAQTNTLEQASPGSEDLLPVAGLNRADSRHGFVRQSASSDALGSADYHSLDSPTLLTTLVSDQSTMDAATTDPRRPQHASLSHSDWPTDAVAAPTFPPPSSVSTSAAVTSSLPVAKAVSSQASSSSPLFSFPTATACVRTATARRQTEAYQREPPDRDGVRRTLQRSRDPLLSGVQVSGVCGASGCRGDAFFQEVGGGSGYRTEVGGGATRCTQANSVTVNRRCRGEVGDGGDEDGSSDGKAPVHRRQLNFQPFKDTAPVCMARTTSASDWVLLNVGGRLITTTASTLMADPDSILASMCACMTRSLRSPPLQQQQPLQRNGPSGESAHRDPTASHPMTIISGLSGSAGVAADRRRGAGRDRRGERGLTSGGGDAQSLAAEYEDNSGEERRGVGGESNATTPAATDALGNSSAEMLLENTVPTNCDGDHSHPLSGMHMLHSPRHPVADILSHSQQFAQAQPRSTHPTPSAASSAPSLSAARDAAGVTEEEGDGEVLNPQQAVSPAPLDTDRYNAILLDLDADYFLPVLNYLRHGAVMIPAYINVDGVLAMAEYLNVSGLVRLLRGPPVPRRVMLFSWGSGGNGELGTHAKRDEPTPTMAQVTPFGVRVREIALGANYSCALTDSGSIYTFGNGEWGQLGLGSGLLSARGGAPAAAGSGGGGFGGALGINNAVAQDGSGADVPVELLTPRRIPLFEHTPAVHVAAGYAFAMAIVEDHHVYFWGNNNHGQSGRGRSFFDPHTKKVDAPVLVETLEGKQIIRLSCGSFFALALSIDGTLYSWGLVDCVGLGTPEEVERRYHAVLGESLSNERRSVVLTPQLVTVRGRRRAGAAAAGSGGTAAERIVRICAGQWHSGAINEHGELFTWGVGYQGRLGHGSKTPAYVPTLVQGALEGQHVVDVACGSFHTVALTSKGDVFCWGDNASGQCGTTANNPDAFTAPYRVVGLEYVAGGVARSIACGRQHTVVVMEGPQPWCMLPCCQVTASGRVAHSHAQVYCFGEVTRTGSGAGANSASATTAAAGNSGALRRPAGGPPGVPMAALNASTLPGSPSHTSFAADSATAALLPLPLQVRASMLGGRPTLAGTAGHHHPHYQLVLGLQHVTVRAVVSGLHHTFAYVEELMTDGGTPRCDSDCGDVEGWVGGGYARPRSQGPSYCRSGGAAARGYNPSYGLPQLGSGAVRGPATVSTAASAPFYLRGMPTRPAWFYPPDWGLGIEGAESVPPPPADASSAAAASSSTRRFYDTS